MRSIKNLSFIFAALLLFGFACDNSSSNEEDLIITNTINDVPADTGSTGEFTFVNLSTGEIVTDSASTDWDLGFAQTNIITNSGVSGPGNGGAFILNNISFDDVTEVPTNITFNEDVAADDLAIPSGSGNGWYNYNPQLFAVFPIEDTVILVRTATGNYAKIEILSYYEGNPDPSDPAFLNPATRPASRYYTFRVTVNEDGGTTFE
jgi:hypothetical protein